MKLQSIYRAINWEVTKTANRLLALKDIAWKPYKEISTDSLFGNYNHKDFFFIQVGANDGITGDDLRKYILKYQWHGILVEPVPYVFDRLIKNYKEVEHLEFLNCAIGVTTGVATFYSISETDLNGRNLFDLYPDFKIDQLSSFDKATIMKHEYMHPDFEKLIIETKISTIGLNELLSGNNHQVIDLLQIDIEGFEFELLNILDLEGNAPRILIFEHHHMPEDKYKTIVKKLKAYKYKFYKSNWDTISVRMDT